MPDDGCYGCRNRYTTLCLPCGWGVQGRTNFAPNYRIVSAANTPRPVHVLADGSTHTQSEWTRWADYRSTE